MKIVNAGGIEASRLKKQTVPDGTVFYLAEVQKHCGPACVH